MGGHFCAGLAGALTLGLLSVADPLAAQTAVGGPPSATASRVDLSWVADCKRTDPTAPVDPKAPAQPAVSLGGVAVAVPPMPAQQYGPYRNGLLLQDFSLGYTPLDFSSDVLDTSVVSFAVDDPVCFDRREGPLPVGHQTTGFLRVDDLGHHQFRLQLRSNGGGRCDARLTVDSHIVMEDTQGETHEAFTFSLVGGIALVPGLVPFELEFACVSVNASTYELEVDLQFPSQPRWEKPGVGRFVHALN